MKHCCRLLSAIWLLVAIGCGKTDSQPDPSAGGSISEPVGYLISVPIRALRD